MADHHGAAGHAARAGDDGFGKVLAVVSGGVALVVGIAMGLSASMGPIGVPMAFSGALWIIWALFYSSPAPTAEAGGGHGHGHGAGGH